VYVYIVHDACLFAYSVYAVNVQITFVFVVLCMHELLVFLDNFHLCCKNDNFRLCKRGGMSGHSSICACSGCHNIILVDSDNGQ